MSIKVISAFIDIFLYTHPPPFMSSNGVYKGQTPFFIVTFFINMQM